VSGYYANIRWFSIFNDKEKLCTKATDNAYLDPAAIDTALLRVFSLHTLTITSITE